MPLSSIASGIGTGISQYLTRKREMESQSDQKRRQEASDVLGLFKLMLDKDATPAMRSALQQALPALFPNVKITGEWPTDAPEATVDVPGVGKIPASEAHKWQPTLLEPGRRASAAAGQDISRGHLDVARQNAVLSQARFDFDSKMRMAALELQQLQTTNTAAYQQAMIQYRQAVLGWQKAYQTAQIALSQGRSDIAARAQAEMARHNREMEGIGRARVSAAPGADPRRAAWAAFFAGKASPQHMEYIRSQIRDPQTAADLTLLTRVSGRAVNVAEEKLVSAALQRLAKKYGIKLEPADLQPGSILQRRPVWQKLLDAVVPGGQFQPDEDDEEDDLEDLYNR